MDLALPFKQKPFFNGVYVFGIDDFHFFFFVDFAVVFDSFESFFFEFFHIEREGPVYKNGKAYWIPGGEAPPNSFHFHVIHEAKNVRQREVHKIKQNKR